MKQPVLSTDRAVTLVGGGAISPGDLDAALALAPVLVAADGGAGAALSAGRMPDAVIGDFDSLQPEARRRIPSARLHYIAEQDSTDFDKALRSVAAPLLLGVGFLGHRLDHQLSAFNTLVRRPDKACILIGPDEIVFHTPTVLRLDLGPGDVVSLFPMASVTGRSTGLRWPIDGLDLAPDGRVGTSNEALGPMSLETDGPGLLTILPRRALDAAVAALRAAP